MSALSIDSNTITGSVFNSGIKEITVPQLLITYYDIDKTLLWIDHLFIKEGIRQQRQQTFTYPLLKEASMRVVNDSMENIFVNGLPNEGISNKIVPDRIQNHTDAQLQKIEHPNYEYIKIEINSYIGNPN